MKTADLLVSAVTLSTTAAHGVRSILNRPKKWLTLLGSCYDAWLNRFSYRP